MYKKILCVLAALLLALPGVCTLLGAEVPVRPLEGVGETARPSVSLGALWDGSFQQGFDKWYAGEFANHDLLVRAYNQLRLSVFGQSSDSVLVGQNGQLYEKPYLDEALANTVEWQMTDEEVAALADGLQRLAALCAQKGKAFAVVISPSKATFLRGDAPASSARGAHYYSEDQRPYHRVRQALAQRGVPCVDGRALLEGGRDYPVFVETGIHWTHAAAVEVVQNLCAVLAQQGTVLPVPRAENITLSGDIFNPTDEDLSRLQNDLQPSARGTYVHYTLAVDEPAGCVRPRILLQGDSFTNTLYDVINAAGLGECTTQLFYQHRMWDTAGTDQTLDGPWEEALVQRIAEADVLVLQSNEQLLSVFGRDAAHTGTPFYEVCAQVLEALPDAPGKGAA